MHSRTVITAALLLAAGCVGADAQVTWKTVPIGGRTDSSIDMPANVNPETKLEPGDLFGFFAKAGDDDLLCLLDVNPYTPDMTRDLVTAGVGSDKRNVFCRSDDPAAKDFEILESKAAVNSGHPAGICASIYTNSSGEKPAQIQTSMDVAAPAGLYTLQCSISAKSDDDLDWVNEIMPDLVHHIQNSPEAAGELKKRYRLPSLKHFLGIA